MKKNKTIQVEVEENLLLSSAKTNLRLLELAKESGYDSVQLLDVSGKLKIKHPEIENVCDIDEEIQKQKDWIREIYITHINNVH